MKAIIIDKVDTAYDIKLSAEVGMHLPLLAGAGGLALLCQLPENRIDRILSENKLKKFTSHTLTNKAKYKEAVFNVRKEGIAIDWEEYIDGSLPLGFHSIHAVRIYRRPSGQSG